MAENVRVSGVAAFLAAGLLGGGAVLPSVAAAEPAAIQGGKGVAERLAVIRDIGEQYGSSVQAAAKPEPDPFAENFINTFNQTSGLS